MSRFLPPLFAILVSTIAAAGATRAASPAPPAPDLSGTWALLTQLSEVASIPLQGQVTVTSRLLGLLTLENDKGNRLKGREQTCRVHTKNSSKTLMMKLPDAFVRSMPIVRRSAELAHVKKQWRFIIPWEAAVQGAKLKDPRKDKLPTDARDKRVTDPDRDGHPGVTVKISGNVNGSVYVTQRVWTELRGVVLSADRVDGIVRWEREQKTLGSSNPFLRGVPTSGPNPDGTQSNFAMRRLPAGTTCAQLMKIAKQVFAEK